MKIACQSGCLGIGECANTSLEESPVSIVIDLGKPLGGLEGPVILRAVASESANVVEECAARR